MYIYHFFLNSFDKYLIVKERLKMMKKSRFVFFLGFLLMFSCFFFGTFVFSYTKVKIESSDEATPIINNEEFYNSESANSNGLVESLIDQLIEKIQTSADECWRKPAINRKNTMVNKINGLNLEDLYDKVLHDIKPKLTGLKTDENEDTWGNGAFNNPWVICSDLQEEFRLLCNDILNPPIYH
jgi:hypothetical protein